MLKRAASKFVNPLLRASQRTSVHFKYEPEEAPADFGTFFGFWTFLRLNLGKNLEEKNMCQAIEHAMDLQLARDESTIIFGEDVKFGGVFRCTNGLMDKYGEDRVFNTPLCEQV